MKKWSLNSSREGVAISNSRLVALSEDNVTFRWRDSAHGNKKQLMTLPVDEFLRRFLLHLLPRGFMRIRNFGFLANRRRAEFLPLCFRLLQQSDQPAAGNNSPAALPTHSQWNCPLCGGTMQVVERLSVAQLLVQSVSRAARQQEYAGPAQFKTFVTQPDAVPHHDRIFVQGLSAALRAPA